MISGARACRRCYHPLSVHRSMVADNPGPCRIEGCNCEDYVLKVTPEILAPY